MRLRADQVHDADEALCEIFDQIAGVAGGEALLARFFEHAVRGDDHVPQMRRSATQAVTWRRTVMVGRPAFQRVASGQTARLPLGRLLKALTQSDFVTCGGRKGAPAARRPRYLSLL